MSDHRDLRVVRVGGLDETPPEHRWLVETLLPYSCVGVIGGQPKSAKSYFGLDLATSIASGTPCLGHFGVARTGPTLVFLAEDSLTDVRRRVADLCRHRELDLASLDLHVIAEPALHLDSAPDRAGLWSAVEEVRPLLVLLDPLVRLHTTLDENSSRDVAGLLGFLRELQRAFDTAVLLVHHTAKKQQGRPGQTLRGSGDLHAWLDVGVYLTWEGDRLRLVLEHRAAPTPEPLALALTSAPDGSGTHLELAQGAPAPPPGKPPLQDCIRDMLRAAKGPLRRAELRRCLRVNNTRLGEALLALEQTAVIVRTQEGWVLAA